LSKLRRLSIAAVVATYLLIVVGAVVRVTDSGLGCPDWPLCHGGVVPPLEMTAILEYSHRVVGAAASTLMAVTAIAALVSRRGDRRVLLAAAGVPALLAIQIPMGGVIVYLELEPIVVLVHLAFALLILGLLVWMSVFADAARGAESDAARRMPSLDPGGRTAAGGGPSDGGRRSAVPLAEASIGRGFLWLTRGTVAAVLGLVLTGAYVRASSATWACNGFPTCNGEAFPWGVMGPLVDIHLIHRTAAYLVAALAAVTIWRAWRTQRHDTPTLIAATALGLAIVAQITIGAVGVSSGMLALIRGLHVAGATAVWLSAVYLTALSQRSITSSQPSAEAARSPSLLRPAPAR
jgi:heme A synthase